jgi:hypothetical protein
MVIPKSVQIVYALSYISKYGRDENFNFLIVDLKSFSYLSIEEVPEVNEIQELLTSLNVKVVNFEEAKKHKYEKLMILPGYVFFASTETFLRNFEYSTIGMVSDGIRNDNYYLDFQLPNNKNVFEVYFGYFNDFVYESEGSETRDKSSKELVEFTYIQETWSRILAKSSAESYDIFQPTDLLLVMRYWGRNPYELHNGIRLEDLMKDVVMSESNISRVVFRAMNQDLNFFESDMSGFRDWLLAREIDFVSWDKIFQDVTVDPFFVNPESLLMTKRINNLGYLFAFDSTLNLVSSIFADNTKVILPNFKQFANIFKNSNTNVIVSEHCELINTVILNPNVELEQVASKIEAKGWRNEVAKKYLEDFFALCKRVTSERDALTQECVTLTQECVTLTQERDALTQERDALTQERDALVTSTIWKTTKSLRGLISWLKKYR